jgi:hypothetical protein
LEKVMSRIYFLIFFIACSFNVAGQNDTQAIIQKILDVRELDTYIYRDQLLDSNELAIVDNGVISPGMSLEKFGHKVIFSKDRSFWVDNQFTFTVDSLRILSSGAHVFISTSFMQLTGTDIIGYREWWRKDGIIGYFQLKKTWRGWRVKKKDIVVLSIPKKDD